MAYTNGCDRKSYGGGREWGRHPTGYRALGALGAAQVTIRGKARYYDGTQGTTRRFQQYTTCETCRKYEDRGAICKEMEGQYITFNDGTKAPKCAWYVDVPYNNKRPDVMGQPGTGGKGWALYIPELIPTTGGYLPGYANLEGDIPPGIKNGEMITVTGQWIGTPPNNLCANCGWPFKVEGTAAATAPVTTDSGALQQDSPEMVEARIEASGIQAEQEALQAGASQEEAQAAREQTQSELSREYQATQNGGTPEATGTPPLTTAGISTGTLATVILGGMFLIPLLTKRGRKAMKTGGVERWGL